jgi:hypothetical protein
MDVVDATDMSFPSPGFSFVAAKFFLILAQQAGALPVFPSRRRVYFSFKLLWSQTLGREEKYCAKMDWQEVRALQCSKTRVNRSRRRAFAGEGMQTSPTWSVPCRHRGLLRGSDGAFLSSL